MELNNTEKLAICQAFYNRVGEMVATKNPDNLRGEVDREMIEAYDRLGCKSFDVKLLGQKVGTYSLTISKPKPSKTRLELEIADYGELLKWAIENGFAIVDEKAVIKHISETGDMPDGANVIQVIEAGDVGGEVSRTTLKVESQEVARILGAQLEPVAQLLLDGGFDD